MFRFTWMEVISRIDEPLTWIVLTRPTVEPSGMDRLGVAEKFVVICAGALAAPRQARKTQAAASRKVGKGMAEAVIIGANPYRVIENPGPNFGGPMEFTYIIKQQQGSDPAAVAHDACRAAKAPRT